MVGVFRTAGLQAAVAIAAAAYLAAGSAGAQGAKPAQAFADQAVPGSVLVTPEVALSYLHICLDSSPTFEAAQAQFQARQMVQNPSSGTWFDQGYNLSLSVASGSPAGRCSMVFASDSAALDLGMMLAMASTQDGNIMVDPNSNAVRTGASDGLTFSISTAQQVNGRTYYRALLAR